MIHFRVCRLKKVHKYVAKGERSDMKQFWYPAFLAADQTLEKDLKMSELQAIFIICLIPLNAR